MLHVRKRYTFAIVAKIISEKQSTNYKILNLFQFYSLYFGDYLGKKGHGRNYDEVQDLDTLQEVRCISCFAMRPFCIGDSTGNVISSGQKLG